jgi:aminomethyltransferase
MGYVASAQAVSAQAVSGRTLFAEVRGKRLPVAVTALPFVPHRYKR